MPFQPANYLQYLLPDEDTGPNEWPGGTGDPHWAQIDDPVGAPDVADYIACGGANMGGKTERFGLTLPNKNNLEGGFDWLRFSIYAWKSGFSVDIPLFLNLYVKGVWQGAQTVTVTGATMGNVAWYFAPWSVFCCETDVASSLDKRNTLPMIQLSGIQSRILSARSACALRTSI